MKSCNIISVLHIPICIKIFVIIVLNYPPSLKHLVSCKSFISSTYRIISIEIYIITPTSLVLLFPQLR
ncbi:hypothetical protein B0I18_10712 [Taibaiella chishuiensis]|uniref:Uncharacterized protein n=1 Tax=Taibaiella chishuiensis TaxID=1434707 RepID=A0A2P8D050_9BACT|nr:hypothetical protein B0I18_10712 [Taibaiella chishuiensis]